jgi:hypothetical protein
MQQAQVIQRHENIHVRNIGQDEARYRKHKRLKLGRCQAYDRFNLCCNLNYSLQGIICSTSMD